MLRKSEEKNFLKKHQFFCKNLLTNGRVSDIISKVTHSGDDHIKNRKKISKKMKKVSKKVLTNGFGCGIISKSLRELR